MGQDGGHQDPGEHIAQRTEELYRQDLERVFARTSRMFAWLMIGQWICAVAIALTSSPYTWSGAERSVHLHVLAAFVLGGLLTSLPVALAWLRPAAASTRFSIAIAQMLWSGLLIHLTGGRIETHFHVFGSLTFLAFYRDWRVLVPASGIVVVDHFVRGMFWPESVYGIASAEWWRFLEHGFWVVYLDVFLLIALRHGVSEMRSVCVRQAEVEALRAREQCTAAQLDRANRWLSAQKTFLELQSEASNEGVLIIDDEGRAVSFNRRFLELWEIPEPDEESPRAEALLSYALERVADRAAFEARVEQIDGGRTEEVALRDGRVFEHTTKTICSSHGERIGSAWLFRDVTEAKRAEQTVREENLELERRVHARTRELHEANAELARHLEELKSAQQRLLLADRMTALGQLSAGIAHDINNPLAYITANLDFVESQLEVLARDDRLEDPLRTDLLMAISDARVGGDHVRTIVSDLKMFARSEGDTRVPLDVRNVLETSIKMVMNEVRHRGRLVRDFGDAPRVHADPGRLGQVFLNLLINATQALPEDGANNEIRVRTRCSDDGRAIIEVTDTGVGIAPNVRNRLFDPFFTTKPVGVGTGLGLSICHGIVTALGGEITVESELGRGTTFRVTLPSCEAPSEPAPPPKSDLRELVRVQILVVDDDPLVLSSVRRVLRGNEVTLRESPRDALALLATRSFDVIVCDLMMPDMTGQQFYEALPAELRSRVVFMTGGAFTESSRRFLEGLGRPHLEKPCSVERLRELVATVGARQRSVA